VRLIMDDRDFAREVARRHFHRTRPTEWFDELYRAAAGNEARIPWADMTPNPGLLEWKRSHDVQGSRALVVGCGLGDDAEEVARWGLRTIACDISPEAVSWCRSRFPESAVEYTVGDILAAPDEWIRAFDFVLEIYTIQSLPPEHRTRMIESLAALVGAGGMLLSITRGRDENDEAGDMPWPLTRSELMVFERHGLKLLEFDDYMDQEEPPVRRFRSLWRRESD
jgi:SAM-dependent methyltransferase